MRKIARAVYVQLDRVLARLDVRLQLRVKGAILALTRAVAPAWVSPDRRAEQLIHGPAPSRRVIPVPAYVLAHMDYLGTRVDPVVHTSRLPLATIRAEDAPQHGRPAMGTYRRMLDAIPHDARVWICIAALRRGGAEKAALCHARSYARLGMRVAIISTDATSEPDIALPDGCRFIDGAGLFQALRGDRALARAVLTRLLVQEAPALLHVIQSRVAWDAIRWHGRAIGARTRRVASVYCDDFDALGVRFGYAEEYLPNCLSQLDALITDNSRTPQSCFALAGVPPWRFRVMPLPVESSERATTHAPERLIWAGRMERQKRPDLAIALAERMPNVQLAMYGTGSLEKALKRRSPANVSWHGAFADFATLPDGVLVVTSEWDGLANVALEAATRGMPVIGFDVGGLSDLLGPHQLARFGDADALSVLAQRALHDREYRESCREHQDAGLRRHRWDRFLAANANLLEELGVRP